jgi:hypothetical protein
MPGGVANNSMAYRAWGDQVLAHIDRRIGRKLEMKDTISVYLIIFLPFYLTRVSSARPAKKKETYRLVCYPSPHNTYMSLFTYLIIKSNYIFPK